ncbi:RagB/SusD family nutrient uptake outer membrane protein [Flavivirga aquimarina]|uniref:RagB/SusD family nutrient uptake outer membrane protein n=1 Tax=Flavivirga aquimarina TaxID=2027862 RepID=A0ABT8WE60_9FLAO|nr:RagB/SusD family nutrient uptake outer membrane protein [Flavivirga aquimarina]MDO5971333.1 RagB/SusD family nutrient uptake outer membrane protein [Flavivirga aquimarina]
MKHYISIFFSLLFASTLLTSCESFLEVSPEEVLLTEDYLGDDKLDARSALFGVLALMQDITGQYIVLGEMRADLVDVTDNTSDEIRQISRHEINPDNSYINPTTLFAIINNCNFALHGIDTEAYDGVLLEDYASILRIRTWAQLQILINFGELPYITKPIASDENLEENYPLLSFNAALDTLIQNLASIEGVENVTKYANSLGYNIFSMIPDQDILLGDLNLWKGDFITAATRYKQFLDNHVSGGGNFYNLSAYGTTTTLNGGNYTVVTAWPSIFDENLAPQEIINYTAFSDQYRQQNNSFEVITNQLKPSVLILQNWASQYRSYNGEAYNQLGDIRTVGSVTGTIGDITPYTEETAKIYKYQYDYFMWNRAAKIYLRYAEAINYAGHPRQALAIVNGIFNTTDAPVDAPLFGNLENFLNFPIGQYYTVNTSDEPISGNRGIRGRVDMAAVNVPENITLTDSIQAVNRLILDENALELAFEGNRWEDLLRFARRSNDPSIIADAVASKFENAGDDAGANAVQVKLMNPENWYLPLTIPDNFVTTD